MLGTLEIRKMTNSANFTVTSVARIRLVHLRWKADCACREVLAHRAVWSDVRKQKPVPFLEENRKNLEIFQF